MLRNTVSDLSNTESNIFDVSSEGRESRGGTCSGFMDATAATNLLGGLSSRPRFGYLARELPAPWMEAACYLRDSLKFTITNLFQKPPEVKSGFGASNDILVLSLDSHALDACEEVIGRSGLTCLPTIAVLPDTLNSRLLLAPGLCLRAWLRASASYNDILTTLLTTAICGRVRPQQFSGQEIRAVSAGAPPRRTQFQAPDHEDLSLSERAKRFREDLHLRRDIFGAAGAESYLSILLLLRAACQEHRSLDVTSLGAELVIAPATLSRKIEYLASLDLVTRATAEKDRRRVLLDLTPKGYDKVSRYLQAIPC